MVTTASFDMVFDGPALADGSIDVRHLGNSMIAIGSLFTEVNRLTNGSSATVKVNVSALSRGSFVVDFTVVHDVTIAMDLTLDADSLKTLIFGAGGAGGVGGVGGLIWFLKALRGRRHRVRENRGDVVVAEVEGETYTVRTEIHQVSNSGLVRGIIRDLVAPLRAKGVDRLAFRENGRAVEEITPDDAASFEYEGDAALLSDVVSTKHFNIVSLTFKEKNLWRLSDGASVIPVKIRDEDFLERVNKNEIAFAKGDRLVVELRTVQRQGLEKIRTEYEALRVEHIMALQFNLEPEDSSGSP